MLAANTNIIFYNTIVIEHIMQEYLDLLYEWLHINKLSINIQKSTEILFNIRNSLSYIRLNITISNIPIECYSNIQFIGLFIDDKINWKIHISHILRKLSKSIANFKYNLNQKVYFSLSSNVLMLS